MKKQVLGVTGISLWLAVIILLVSYQSAANGKNQLPASKKDNNFGRDVELLGKYVNTIVLSDSTGLARIAVVPEYQGRVMTSTADGNDGLSYGWINHELISSGRPQPQIHIFGGEDRFNIGPEGGQYSIFFDAGKSFDFKNWKVTALVDTVPFELIEKSKNYCEFRKQASLKNYSNTVFDFKIDRTVRVLEREQIQQRLNRPMPAGVKMVGYETVNSITNTGNKKWQKQTGLLSVWILGMFKHSPGTTVVIPFKQGDEKILGTKVKDDYFGKVPPDRLVVEDDVLFFRADGKYRSKIGISPFRAKSLLGSYDADNNVLTIVRYNQHPGITDYVNSAWKIQDDPFKGDVVNSYNDGPAAPGEKPLGPFYELETSSPALELEPGQKVLHITSTMHFTGPKKDLDQIAKTVFGVSIEKITKVFKK